MKRTLLGLAIIGLSCNALADTLYPSGFYVGARVGTSILHPEKIKIDDSNNSYTKAVFAGSVVAGYDFSYDFDVPVRAELDYTLRTRAKKDINSGSKSVTVKARADTLLANFYYDLYTGTGFTPYLTAGLGVAFDKATAELTGNEVSKKKTKFAWAVGIGTSYNITDALSADFTVRYIDAGKVKNDDSDDSVKVIGGDILLGIRYAF